MCQDKILIAFLFLSFLGAVYSTNCYRDLYDRGKGHAFGCNDQQYDAGLCYPYCRNGYTGVGPVCWQNCPSGFPDTGADCLKPSSYGRGAGYTTKSQCVSHFPSEGCEEWGLLWYPKCRANFHNVACCVCSPDCQNGMIDIGVSCQKDSYGRGVGKPISCASNEEEQNLECYSKCKNGYDGTGRICFEQCPKGLHACGALCVDTEAECVQGTKDVVGLVKGIVDARSGKDTPTTQELIKMIAKVIPELAHGVCNN